MTHATRKFFIINNVTSTKCETKQVLDFFFPRNLLEFAISLIYLAGGRQALNYVISPLIQDFPGKILTISLLAIVAMLGLY